jgi:hypothetical protein
MTGDRTGQRTLRRDSEGPVSPEIRPKKNETKPSGFVSPCPQRPGHEVGTSNIRLIGA